MYSFVLKAFQICWRIQKSWGQEPVFLKVIQKGNFSQYWQMMQYRDGGKVQGFEAGWEIARLSAVKLSCCLIPDEKSVVYPFYPPHCTEPHVFFSIHTWQLVYSDLVDFFIWRFPSSLKIMLYLQYAQQSDPRKKILSTNGHLYFSLTLIVLPQQSWI